MPKLKNAMPRKKYYLSEIAVSSQYGGGLTLQRILADDLRQFDNFFHVGTFAILRDPIIDELKPKQVNLDELASLVDTKPGSLRDYCERVIARLRLQRWFESKLDKRIRKYAEYVLHNFELTRSSWLVVPQNRSSVQLMNRLFRTKRVDYVTWLMDDHVIRWNADRGWYYPDGFEDEFGFHLRNARKVLVISTAMARLYQDRFGVNSEVVFGPADPVEAPVHECLVPTGPIRLSYFGALWKWQLDPLEDLVRNLPSLNATLDIFSPNEVPESLKGGMVNVQPLVPAQDVMHRMRQYDGVVIPASSKWQNRNLTELNISTKLSECLVSGTVTVIIGPEYAAMVQFVRAHGGALVVSDFGDPTQIASIGRLKNSSFREHLLNQARKTAEITCSVQAMRRVWRKCWPPEKDDKIEEELFGACRKERTDQPLASSDLSAALREAR
jgi:hypothetical protein